MTDELKSPFVFVPEGAEVPDAVRGPGWIRIPATFVPRSGGGPTTSGQSWPKDRNGLDWTQGRDGHPICPLTELPPGGPVPDESTLRAGDPVATFLAMDAVFRDPARAAGLTIPVAGKAASGVEVVLPNGSKVPDEKSPTGWLMAPTADLRSVALAGRNAGILFKEIENDPDIEGASWTFIGRLGVDLGHGGKFDYQRQGNFLTGYSHFRQFADVSNFNVGLYC